MRDVGCRWDERDEPLRRFLEALSARELELCPLVHERGRAAMESGAAVEGSAAGDREGAVIVAAHPGAPDDEISVVEVCQAASARHKTLVLPGEV